MAKAYFGVPLLAGVNVVCVILLSPAGQGVGDVEQELAKVLTIIGVETLIVFLASLPVALWFAAGKAWPLAGGVGLSLLLALNSWVFYGAIGLLVLAMAAAKEIEKYGIRGSVLHLRRDVVMRRIEKLRADRNEATCEGPR